MSDKANAPVNASPSISPLSSGGILQRQCQSCGQHKPTSEECPECKKKSLLLQRKAVTETTEEGPPSVEEVLRPQSSNANFSQIPVRSSTTSSIQPELQVSRPGDRYELEADRVADRVMAASAFPPAMPGPLQIQRYSEQSSESTDTASASVAPVLASPGRPLAPALQQEMGQRFGYDFSQVRVHTDTAAERSARDVDANAYTVGHHIVFGAGQYTPETGKGQRLIAHELTHVVQQGNGRVLQIQRSRCGHDGQNTKCGASNGVWKLVDQSTSEANLFSLDDLIVEGGLKGLGGSGEWIRQVQSPPNLAKSEAAARGRIDGVKVKLGSALDVEVVEIKSRSNEGGGCAKATAEANGYINELKTLAPLIPPMSAKLAAGGGLQVEGGKCKTPKAAERIRLQAAGVDFNNPSSVNAWCFYNSLQDRLGKTFTTPFSSVSIRANSDGVPNTPYDVQPPVVINCRKTKKNPKGLGLRFLEFQVNQKGGVSYGCRDVCAPQPEEEKSKEKTAEVSAADEVKTMDEQFQSIEQYDRLELLPDVALQPGTAAQASGDSLTPDRDTHEDRPTQLPPGGVSELDALKTTAVVITTVAVLHVAIKYAKTKAEKELGRKLIEKTIVEGAEKGALEIAKKLDSANLVKYGTKEGEVLLKGADEAMVLAAKNSPRLAAKLGPAAIKGLAKAGPIIGLVLAANDARAAISHVSKGGTIEFGPSLDSKELKGDTQIKNQGAEAGKEMSGDVLLTDTIVDIETKGMPNFEGNADIEANKVTIRGAAPSDGGSVTLNMKVKLSNTTVTFKNSGVIQNGKVVVGDVDIKDSQIEVDLPPETFDPGRKPGEKKTITGAKIKVTSLSGGGTGSSVSPGTSGSSTPSAPGATATPVSTSSTPVAGPDRPALIQQIRDDQDLLKMYSALAGKEGIVASDEVLRRFVSLKAMIKRHPNAVQAVISSIKPGQITDPIKQIIEPIEQILSQENAKLGEKLAQSVSGKTPATGASSGAEVGAKPADGKSAGQSPTSSGDQASTSPDKTSDKSQTPSAKPDSSTPASTAGGATATATNIQFSAIFQQLHWPNYEAPQGDQPPATYTYWVNWTANAGGTQLIYRIPLALKFSKTLPPGRYSWLAEYKYAPPSGVFTTEQGDIPIQFSDAGVGDYTTRLYTTKGT